MINNTSKKCATHPLLQPTKDLPIEPSKKKPKGKKHINQNSDSLVKMHFKKPRQANWERVKVLTLMQYKKEKHEEMMAKVGD